MDQDRRSRSRSDSERHSRGRDDRVPDDDEFMNTESVDDYAFS